MTATAVTLNQLTLQVIHRMQVFSIVIRGIFVHHCIHFKGTVCSHDFSAFYRTFLEKLWCICTFKRAITMYFAGAMASNLRASMSMYFRCSSVIGLHAA